ncbi:hypothetical protein JZ751_004055 [Albula glossodonta]|uniref:Uncharacterized protein n=1 Tax=Albula glossodonta TaxID=121402 RepID=A0A8T2P641_9TELE|nr:hypothetical protein JZ751_004055 [Albula glossodonta]
MLIFESTICVYGVCAFCVKAGIGSVPAPSGCGHVVMFTLVWFTTPPPPSPMFSFPPPVTCHNTPLLSQLNQDCPSLVQSTDNRLSLHRSQTRLIPSNTLLSFHRTFLEVRRVEGVGLLFRPGSQFTNSLFHCATSSRCVTVGHSAQPLC